MPTSSPYAAFDIVLVPFPYADRLAEKRRPALVVSGKTIADLGLIWVAMITSAANPGWPGDIPVPPGAGLPAPSVIRAAKVACLDPDRVIGWVGSLDGVSARKVSTQLASYFASA